jgi:hypothetical protein
MHRLLLVLATSLFASTSAAQPPQVDRVDPSGIPVWCPGIAQRPPLRPTLSIAALPAGTRGWECVPGVIRNDGVETFRLEVDVNGSVQAVRLTSVTPYVIGPSAEPIVLHDDGIGADRVAGDAIWTAGPFRSNLALSFPAFYANDSSSPSGLYSTGLGTLTVEEVGGSLTQFLLGPSIGLLRSDVPAVSVVQSGVDRVITPHLVNLSSPDRVTQKFMRFLGADIGVLTRRVYAALPDVFDFLFFFSNDKIERTPRTASDNFVAGLHSQVQTNYTGTGLVPYSDAAWYGSAGKLLGVNCLDAYDRGVVGNNATHELTHQWGSYTSMSLNLNDGTNHYHYLTSVGSLIGGFAFTDNGNGTFTRNCDEGRNGAHHASPLDLYLMGLIADPQVPGQRRSQLPGSPACDQVIDSYTTTTVADIQAVHGARTPGPATSQKTFALGFVIESNGRLLNATERTYYDRLAEHYTKVLPPQTPDPYVGFNWPPITRFFGQGTTWISDIVQLTTSVPPPPMARATLALAAPFPNPTREGARIEWMIPEGSSAEARLDVIDSQGRRVSALARGPATPGWHVAFWDGRDSEGRATAPGVYWIRLRHPAGSATRKLVRISGQP